MFHAMSVDMPHLEDTVDSSTAVPGSKTQIMLMVRVRNIASYANRYVCLLLEYACMIRVLVV